MLYNEFKPFEVGQIIAGFCILEINLLDKLNTRYTVKHVNGCQGISTVKHTAITTRLRSGKIDMCKKCRGKGVYVKEEKEEVGFQVDDIWKPTSLALTTYYWGM